MFGITAATCGISSINERTQTDPRNEKLQGAIIFVAYGPCRAENVNLSRSVRLPATCAFKSNKSATKQLKIKPYHRLYRPCILRWSRGSEKSQHKSTIMILLTNATRTGNWSMAKLTQDRYKLSGGGSTPGPRIVKHLPLLCHLQFRQHTKEKKQYNLS